MKKTVTLKIALTLASTFLAGATSWAGGAPGDMGMGTFTDDSVPGVGNMGMMDNSGSFNPMMGGNFSMPVDPNSLANTYSGGMGGYGGGMMGGSGIMGGGMMGGGGYSNGGGSGMPMLDLRQVVQQGIQGLPQQQLYGGASNMANQNLSQLNQSMGNSMSPVSQIRNSVRNDIMKNRISDISRMGQATFRPMVQPGAVQSMISQIQPWNFPARFQSAMMPNMIPMVSAPIKQNQMSFMQSGIMNNPNFPNVPLPMPMFGSSSSGGYGNSMPGNQGMYGGGMMPGNQGMYGGNSGGMMPGNQGMYGGGMMPGNQGMYGGGMMPGNQGMMPNMQNMMMPNMQNMMMQNMMPSMMPNMGYGY